MKKFFSFLLLFFVTSFFFPTRALAQICSPSYPSSAVNGGQDFTITFDLSGEPPADIQSCNGTAGPCYQIRGCNTGWSGTYGCLANSTFDLSQFYPVTVTNDPPRITSTLQRDQGLTFWLEKRNSAGNLGKVCGNEWTVSVVNQASCASGTFNVVGVRNGSEVEEYTRDDDLRAKFDGTKTSKFIQNGVFDVYRENSDGSGGVQVSSLVSPAAGNERLHLNGSLTGNIELGRLPIGSYRLVITDSSGGSYEYCAYGFEVSTDPADPDNEGEEGGAESVFELCKQAGKEGSANWTACDTCFKNNGVWTAVGCIPFSDGSGDATAGVTAMLRAFVTIGLGIAGGVTVLMVLAGSFLLSTSQGDPKRVEEGRSLVTSAVIGLLFIIFSVSILRFIGVDILQIPGFGR